ncbi:transcriptional repressor [uncultured Sutterella sp.]|uniref:Fur family transcriptional regulator n=1 Tax=uncultured Sutterella sp. TaxID=286133 RepID=UPI0025FD835E|nr:transcriptional repressor [uncultured Sutterella sp.]
MPQGVRYATRQRAAVLSCLKARAGEYLTAAEVAEAAKAAGAAIGLTTVYRTLENLRNEGLVRRFVLDRATPAAYEYLEDPAASEFHVRCRDCGKLFHLRCSEIARMEEALSGHLLEEHGVELDLQSSVIQGRCSECRAKVGATAGGKPAA